MSPCHPLYEPHCSILEREQGILQFQLRRTGAPKRRDASSRDVSNLTINLASSSFECDICGVPPLSSRYPKHHSVSEASWGTFSFIETLASDNNSTEGRMLESTANGE